MNISGQPVCASSSLAAVSEAVPMTTTAMPGSLAMAPTVISTAAATPTGSMPAISTPIPTTTAAAMGTTIPVASPSSGSSAPTAAIAGGVAGALVCVSALIVLLIARRRRHKTTAAPSAASTMFANPIFSLDWAANDARGGTTGSESGVSEVDTDKLFEVQLVPSYFHGSISQSEAERVLVTSGLGNGAFVVSCDYARADRFVLSVLHDDDVQHVFLKPSPNGYTLDRAGPFAWSSNVHDIISHLCTHHESPLPCALFVGDRANNHGQILNRHPPGKLPPPSLLDVSFPVNAITRVVPVLCATIRAPPRLPLYRLDKGELIAVERNQLGASCLFAKISDLTSDKFIGLVPRMYPDLGGKQRQGGPSTSAHVDSESNTNSYSVVSGAVGYELFTGPADPYAYSVVGPHQSNQEYEIPVSGDQLYGYEVPATTHAAYGCVQHTDSHYQDGCQGSLYALVTADSSGVSSAGYAVAPASKDGYYSVASPTAGQNSSQSNLAYAMVSDRQPHASINTVINSVA